MCYECASKLPIKMEIYLNKIALKTRADWGDFCVSLCHLLCWKTENGRRKETERCDKSGLKKYNWSACRWRVSEGCREKSFGWVAFKHLQSCPACQSNESLNSSVMRPPHKNPRFLPLHAVMERAGGSSHYCLQSYSAPGSSFKPGLGIHQRKR